MALVARRPRPVVLLPAVLACLAAALGLGSAPGLQASLGQVSEYAVKAAYLYYFATYVEWPPDALDRKDKSFVIGVLGDDPFGPILEETFRDKSLGDRHFVVRRFLRIQDARDSHILFISSSEKDRLPAILGTLKGAPLLTVGESDRFAEHGGEIGLRMDGNRVRFEINVQAAERSGLKISSQLLKLGSIAREPGTSKD